MKNVIIVCCLAMALTASAANDAAKPVTAGTAPNAAPAASADMVRQKMEKIVFPSVELENANIYTVIRYLNRSGKHYDPDNTGIPVISGIAKQHLDKLPRFTVKATQISFAKLLDQLKLNYKIDEGAIVILASANTGGK